MGKTTLHNIQQGVEDNEKRKEAKKNERALNRAKNSNTERLRPRSTVFVPKKRKKLKEIQERELRRARKGYDD